MDRILLKNGQMVCPAGGIDEIRDLLIEKGKIVKTGKNLKAESARTIDASGKLVLPGFIDMHVHLREPGFEHKETIESGARAAVKGGFTSVCCMPNTEPVIDNQGIVELVATRAREAGLASVYCIGAITRGRKGKELSDIGELKAAGVLALSDDGSEVLNSELLRRAMEYASTFGLFIISHCEDPWLAAGGSVNEGAVSTRLGLGGIPRVAETVMVSRDIALAAYLGAKIHIAHISCAESVDMVRAAKKAGVKVTCECAPHHMFLTEEAVLGYNTNTKVNPPLRTEADRQAVLSGLLDNTIDCVATDHAPHAEMEKDVEYDNAPFGVTGLETAVGLMFTELVDRKIITVSRLAEKMSLNPARILGLNRGTLKEGSVADITVIDPKAEWAVRVEDFVSLSKNSPFIDRKLKGKAVMTIVEGKIVYEEKD